MASAPPPHDLAGPFEGPPVSAADEAAFVQNEARLAGQYAVIGSVFILLVTVVWWPIDHLVMRPGPEREAFGTLRTHAAAIEIVLLVAFATSRWCRAHVLLIGPIGYAALLAAIGHALGQLGPAGLTWLADAFIGIIPVAFIPLRLGWRVVATVGIAGALLGGFFLPYPGNIDAPMAWGQVSFAAFAVCFSILLGGVSRRVLRRVYLQKRQLDAANAELSDLSASLAERVADKTRELQSLAQHLDGALEAQRRRIARDLHDDLGQSLTAIRYTLARLDGRLPDRAEPVDELLEDLDGLVDGTHASIRGFLSELRPRVLDDYGLAAAAEWHCNRVRELSGLACRLTVDPAFPGALDADGLPGGARLDHDTALALFRVLQEGTTNTLKHADASRIEVTLSVEGERFGVTVVDDGVGFDPATVTDGFGLLGLRERVHARGGRFDIDGTGGTRIHAALAGEVIETRQEND